MSRAASIIAEIGSVHDGSFGNAKRLIDSAAECGADTVKFQTHIASAETVRDAPMPPYFKGEPRYEYFERTGFSEPQWVELREHCESRGVEFLSTPFSTEAVHLLERVGVVRYKIASGEVTNLPMLTAIAGTQKPVLLSSGMSTWDELDEAVDVLKGAGSRLTVLQCTTEYPCPPERVGLNVMLEMRERYGLPVGLSDHTLSNSAALAAVTLGASAVEKHFTLSRGMYGSDAMNAAEPRQFADLVRGVREIESMMESEVDKSDASPFAEMKDIFQKSVVAVVDVPAGATISAEMLGIKKPGLGVPPGRLDEVVGSRALRAIPADSVVTDDDFAAG